MHADFAISEGTRIVTKVIRRENFPQWLVDLVLKDIFRFHL